MLIKHVHVHIAQSENEKIIILINRENHIHNSDNFLFLSSLLLYSKHILLCTHRTAHQINQTLVAFCNAFGDHKSLNLGRDASENSIRRVAYILDE